MKLLLAIIMIASSTSYGAAAAKADDTVETKMTPPAPIAEEGPLAAPPPPTPDLPPDVSAPGMPASSKFHPGSWSKGVHLLTGFGINTSALYSDTTHRSLGLGSNFKADVAYLLNDHLAFELGSAVKFNRSGDYLIWDTLFTVGVRYRFHSLLFKTDGTFVRLFAGESPTVIYLGDSSNPLKAIGASRAQINGPLVGFGGGCFFQTEKKLTWFIEWDAAYQWLRYQDAIVDQNDVPIVLQSTDAQNSPKIFSLALNIGLVLF